MQKYLGMYDVSHPKLRSAIFLILQAYGIHRQKSVFECSLDFEQKKELLEHLTMVSMLFDKRICLIKILPRHPESQLYGRAKLMPGSDCLYIG